MATLRTRTLESARNVWLIKGAARAISGERSRLESVAIAPMENEPSPATSIAR